MPSHHPLKRAHPQRIRLERKGREAGHVKERLLESVDQKDRVVLTALRTGQLSHVGDKFMSKVNEQRRHGGESGENERNAARLDVKAHLVHDEAADSERIFNRDAIEAVNVPAALERVCFNAQAAPNDAFSVGGGIQMALFCIDNGTVLRSDLL